MWSEALGGRRHRRRQRRRRGRKTRGTERRQGRRRSSSVDSWGCGPGAEAAAGASAAAAAGTGAGPESRTQSGHDLKAEEAGMPSPATPAGVSRARRIHPEGASRRPRRPTRIPGGRHRRKTAPHIAAAAEAGGSPRGRPEKKRNYEVYKYCKYRTNLAQRQYCSTVYVR